VNGQTPSIPKPPVAQTVSAVAKRIAMAIAASLAPVPLVVLQRLLNQHVAAKKLSRNRRAAPMANAVVTKRVLVNVANQVHVLPAVLLRLPVQIVPAN